MIALVLLAFVGVGYWVVGKTGANSAPASSAAPIRTARIGTGSVVKQLRAAGVTSAKNFVSVAAPVMRGPDAGRALVLIYLVKSGSMVKKGELLAQIDAQSLKDHVEDVNTYVIQADADIKKRQAEQAIEIENLRQSLRTAKATFEKAKLDSGAAEIRTAIDIELLKIGVQEAEAQVKQLTQDVQTKQIAHNAEIKILTLTKERHVRHRDRHKIDVERFTMRAPMNGLAVMQTIFRGGEFAQIQEGDQISPGQPFMKVVDSASMQMEASVNQVDAEQLRLGQAANIQFDAFPGLSLTGKLQSVGALATGSWRQNYYIRNVPIRLAIQGSDPRVIPDLSVSADIRLASSGDGLVVPLAAVFESGNKLLSYVKQADQWVPREVVLGMRGSTTALVKSGLSAGEEVALTDPTAAAKAEAEAKAAVK